MNTLRVTPEEVRITAGNIRTRYEDMTNLMQQMGMQVQQLPAGDVWHSMSGTNFHERYQQVQNQCQGALNTLMNHINNLEEAAAVYEETEQVQKTKVSSLDPARIFN